MRTFLVLVAVVFASLAAAVLVQPASACEWVPSSDCPAPSAAGSHPCYANQVKANWGTMTYHLPAQPSYRSVGGGPEADIWCFDSEQQALSYGFRRSLG